MDFRESSKRDVRIDGLVRRSEAASIKPSRLGCQSASTETLVQRELISHQILLPIELAPALPTILGDRVQLQQVIINLTMNGIEAMQSVTDRPRELMIRSRQDEKQQVLVSVTDCGVGISAENVDRLFNAFCRTVVRSAVYPLADHFHQIPQAAGRPQHAGRFHAALLRCLFVAAAAGGAGLYRHPTLSEAQGRSFPAGG